MAAGRRLGSLGPKGLNNPDECGELVELAIRKFLKEIIGERFKITHGYIYSAKKGGLSPQIDIIITDKLVPHTLKRFEHLDNLEVVPAEAVVAVFEVKRTLDSSALKRAGEHLTNIFDYAEISKQNSKRYLLGGKELNSGPGINIDGGLLSNPLIGILGLSHKGKFENFTSDIPWMIDTVFSFDGRFLAPQDPSEKKNFILYLIV